MARSEIKTWLSLDRFSQIMGFDPLLYNSLFSPSLHKNTTCGETFYQYSWQHSDRVGREDMARAIQEAEQEISREVGYNLMPEWTTEERLDYPRPANREMYNVYGVNVRWMAKSVEALKGHVISGGVRAKSVIQLAAAVARADLDGDGYAETATVTVPITITDTNEVHVYYAGRGGDDGWEVRPIKVSISGGFATITFKSWQIPLGTQMDKFDIQPLDADSAASYETTVDVYRVYNDPGLQLQFLWENANENCCGTCVACQLSTQAGCFHLRDERLGIVVPTPATYSSETGEFTAQEWSACREPDQIRLWYYSGYRDNSLSRPYADLSPYWETAVAYFAASKFERPVCGCSNVSELISKWRRDGAFTSQNEGGFTMTAEQAANRLGTTLGAIYAWKRINQNGVRVNK